MAEQALDVCGIYAIENTVSGRAYVGSAKNIRQRWRRHRALLVRQAHHCPQLQRAWTKYGPDAFLVVVLEHHDDKSTLLAAEQVWLDGCCDLYNVCKDAVAPMRNAPASVRAKIGRPKTDADKARLSELRRGKKASEETRKKQSEAHKRRMTPEIRAALSAHLAPYRYMPKGPRSMESRRKQSESRTGKPHPQRPRSVPASAETRAKISASKKGKNSPTQEMRARISRSLTGRPLSPERALKLASARSLLQRGSDGRYVKREGRDGTAA